jgi:hypothetical protein
MMEEYVEAIPGELESSGNEHKVKVPDDVEVFRRVLGNDGCSGQDLVAAINALFSAVEEKQPLSTIMSTPTFLLGALTVLVDISTGNLPPDQATLLQQARAVFKAAYLGLAKTPEASN